jgi:hypothetical protein
MPFAYNLLQAADPISRLIARRFPRLHLVAGGYHDFFNAGPSLRVTDRARGHVVYELEVPRAMHDWNPDRWLSAYAGRLMQTIALYQDLVDAFEGRRPVVWS